MRVFDLQYAFARTRAAAKYFQNQSGAVEHLRAPGLFKISLLHWRERAIHDNKAGLLAFNEPRNFVDLAFADIGRGANLAERYHAAIHNLQIDGLRQSDRLSKSGVGRAPCRTYARDAAARRPQVRTKDNCASGLRASRRAQAIRTPFASPGFQSDLFCRRRALFRPLEQLDRVTRHDGGDGVLVNQLRMSITPQQHAE